MGPSFWFGLRLWSGGCNARLNVCLPLAVLCLLLLTGCWDSRELEDYGFVTVVGIDEGESEDMIRVTYQIAKPRTFSNKGETVTAEEASEIISIETPSLFESRNLVNVNTSRVISLVQAKVLVISEAFAKRGDVVNRLDSLVRERDFRRDIILLTCKGKAETFLRENDPQLEPAPYRYYEIITQNSRETGLIPNTQLHDFLIESEGMVQSSVTILSALEDEEGEQPKDPVKLTAGQVQINAKNKAQFLGSAVYQDQKLVGFLNGEETRLMQLVRGNIRQFNTNIVDPKSDKRRFAILVRQQNDPQIEVNSMSNPIRVRAAIELEVDIASIQNSETSVRSEQDIQAMEKQTEKMLEREFRALVEKSQEELRSDVFQFYAAARRNCMTSSCWESKEWKKRFPKADINIDVTVNIRRTGKQLENLKGGRG